MATTPLCPHCGRPLERTLWALIQGCPAPCNTLVIKAPIEAMWDANNQLIIKVPDGSQANAAQTDQQPA